MRTLRIRRVNRFRGIGRHRFRRFGRLRRWLAGSRRRYRLSRNRTNRYFLGYLGRIL
jgi:hypothetical protein